MRVNRQDFLQQLEAVSPGLSPKGLLEQSECFVFKDGEVVTYNEEISCRHPTNLKKFEGAVQAGPLLSILHKLDDDELEIQTDGEGDQTELILTGRKRSTGIRMDAGIFLPIHLVEQPKRKEWGELHPDFGEAVQLVHYCASTDASSYNLSCVHITPKYVEATDNYHIMRYKLKTGFEDSTLIRGKTIKHLTNLGMNKYNLTETWAHFSNPNGLVFSCRRSVEHYKDGSDILKQEGEAMNLPKGLIDALDRCQVFSAEIADDDQVLVELRPGKMRVKGVGNTGWHRELKKLKYAGDELSFRIPPGLFKDLCKKYNDCQVTADMLKVSGGKFTYVTSLGEANPETKSEAAEEPTDDEESEE